MSSDEYRNQLLPDYAKLQAAAATIVRTFHCDTGRWQRSLRHGNTAAWISLLVALVPNLSWLSLSSEASIWNEFFHPVFGPGEADTETLAEIPGFNAIKRLSLSTPLINLDEVWLCLPNLKTFELTRPCHVKRTQPRTTNFGVESVSFTSTIAAYSHGSDDDLLASQERVLTGTPMVKNVQVHMVESVFDTVFECDDSQKIENCHPDDFGSLQTGRWVRRDPTFDILFPSSYFPFSYAVVFQSLSPVSAQLERVAITLEDDFMQMTMTPEASPYFRGFVALKCLEIPQRMLESCGRYGASPGNLDTVQIALPPNLEELRVNYPSADIAFMVNDITRRESAVSKLRDVYINISTHNNPMHLASSKTIYEVLNWDSVQNAGLNVHFDASEEETECWLVEYRGTKEYKNMNEEAQRVMDLLEY